MITSWQKWLLWCWLKQKRWGLTHDISLHNVPSMSASSEFHGSRGTHYFYEFSELKRSHHEKFGLESWSLFLLHLNKFIRCLGESYWIFMVSKMVRIVFRHLKFLIMKSFKQELCKRWQEKQFTAVISCQIHSPVVKLIILLLLTILCIESVQKLLYALYDECI